MHDPTQAADALILLISSCVEKAYTVKKTNHKNKQLPRKTWITKGIIVSCNKKEELYNLWRLDPGNEQLEYEYKIYNKTLRRIIDNAKTLYDKIQIQKNINDPKKLWGIVKSIIGKGSRKNDEIECISDGSVLMTNPTDIANCFNDFFTNVGKNLSEKIAQPPNVSLQLPQFTSSTIYLYPVAPEEVHKIIKDMKPKIGGIDGIHAKTIKNLEEFILEPLVYIINLSIGLAIWPDALKNAEIKPIFKEGDKQIPTNYRPISLISNFAKILEKIIFNRLFSFIKKNKILSDNQFGFVKNIGTNDALGLIANLILEKIDKKKPIAVTFLDLAKAFDTVDHKILIEKLKRYGIRGHAIKLLTSYLQNRKQRVKINGKVSKFNTVTTGVPQGTILGPLLFILYINDLLFLLPSNNIFSYADDTAVVATGNGWEFVQTKMNHDLSIISDWLAINKLSLNIKKTVYLNFGSYNTSIPNDLRICINNFQIEQKHSHKYLGIIFDSNLKWDIHIKYIFEKTKYLPFLFYRLAKIMQPDTLKMIYYAFFHSLINYGNIAWGGAYDNYLTLLHRLQQRILKIINKNRLAKNNPMTLEQLFNYNSVLFYYEKLKNNFERSTSVTRFKLIEIPKRNKTISSKNNYLIAVRLFNSLPNELKVLSKNQRKQKLKEWIVENI